MSPVGFEPTISASERTQTYATDRAPILGTASYGYLFLARKTPVGQGLLIHEVSRSHNDAPVSKTPVGE